MFSTPTPARFAALAVLLFVPPWLEPTLNPREFLLVAWYGLMMSLYSAFLYSVRHWAYALSFAVFRFVNVVVPGRLPELSFALAAEPLASTILVACGPKPGALGEILCPQSGAIGAAMRLFSERFAEPAAAHLSAAAAVVGSAIFSRAAEEELGDGDGGGESWLVARMFGKYTAALESAPPPQFLVQLTLFVPLAVASLALRFALFSALRRATARPEFPDVEYHIGRAKAARARELGITFTRADWPLSSAKTESDCKEQDVGGKEQDVGGKEQDDGGRETPGKEKGPVVVVRTRGPSSSVDFTLFTSAHWPWAAVFHVPVLFLALLQGTKDYDMWKKAGFEVPADSRLPLVLVGCVAHLWFVADRYSRAERLRAYRIKGKGKGKGNKQS